MYTLRHQFSHLLSQTFHHCSTCLTPAVSLTLTLLIPCEYQPIHLYCSSAMSHQHTQCTRKCSQTPTPGAYRPLQGAACSHSDGKVRFSPVHHHIWLNPELDPWFSSGGFLEPWTEPSVQVQGGPVQVQKGFKCEPNVNEDLRALAYVIIKNEHSFCARYRKGVNALWGISQKTVFIAMYEWNLSP